MLLLRHAQSEWNVHFGATRVDPGIFDPPLTEEGEAQALAAAQELRGKGIRRLLASPYRRTLQTASIVARELGLPIAVEPLVRERCAFSCDQGSPASTLAGLWPELDFAGLEERWWGKVVESTESLRARADLFLGKAARMVDRDTTAVVSHWGFIRCVTGQEVGNTGAVRLRLDRPAPAQMRNA
ncbi:histidine phosphatase family protein [Marinimicrococcus flavescens]|uniref:Phosphoglycerate mutase family protein n=1 Tax=Marinimicrococcus flavescens TaxID=3031815 RepID=A0AAP3XQN4_9PROT|nr:phosphoglycerate mutase family protein [Marinimicrococcus flavescens]